jgi:hypothetical protein
LGDLGENGRIILKWISVKEPKETVDLSELAQDRDKWRVLMNVS